MLRIALKMLAGDRAKYAGLLLGIAFTAFLVTFAASYFAGFMTRGFALVAENPQVDVWVMDPAVESPEQVINMPDPVLARVRNVEGVAYAAPLAVGAVEARFPNGRFQSFRVIGVDDATLLGAPFLAGGNLPDVLRRPDAVIADAGGTVGKLETPLNPVDQWPQDGPHLGVATRELRPGDELLVDERRVLVAGRSQTLPRFPPRPLLYTTFGNALRILPRQRHQLTFVLVKAREDIARRQLAERIREETGMRARRSGDFKADTVRWYLVNSEDVGDMAAMLILAMSVGFGVTGVMLFMFTLDSLRQYAVLKAMGATPKRLLTMVFMQAAVCALLGTGIGLGICALVGRAVTEAGYPFRMMWFAPLIGALGVLVVSLTAAAISIRPVLKLQPATVFAGR